MREVDHKKTQPIVEVTTDCITLRLRLCYQWKTSWILCSCVANVSVLVVVVLDENDHIGVGKRASDLSTPIIAEKPQLAGLGQEKKIDLRLKKFKWRFELQGMS